MAANQRFRVPSHNGEVLAVPDLATIPKLIEENRHSLDRSDVKIGGTPLKEFRSQARFEILSYTENPLPSLTGPLILAGHQPELAHPGVWVKNFVLNGLARKVGGVPLNLIVDNDNIKSTSLHFPSIRIGDASSVRLETVPFDIYSGATTYEDHRVQAPDLFQSFPDRAAPLWRNWDYEPLLPTVWRSTPTICDAFTRARQKCERSWGCHNREILVSRLSQTTAFARFAKHILNDLPRFQEAYNRALRSYRRNNHIRSKSHPAPELVEDEAPFWHRKADTEQRQRATTSCDVRALRPRALTLTLFARLCLGDLFIHGIGGGKYDEVTDQIIRAYYGIEPPMYLVLSATLHLPLPAFPSTIENLRQAERRVRDLRWNPQRHLEGQPAPAIHAMQQLIFERKRLIKAEPVAKDRRARRNWFRSLRSVTDGLFVSVESQIPLAEETRKRIQVECEANAVINRRDYSWVLYPESTLRPFLQGFLD